MGIGEVDGLVEADECYLRYSCKGNHSKSKRFTMSRPARKRGGESVGKRTKVYVQSQSSYSLISNDIIKGRQPMF